MKLTHESSVRDLIQFTKAYLECALWCSSVDEDGGSFESANFSIDDVSSETLCAATKECGEFLLSNVNALNDTPEDYTVEQAGHDFWLTRNGHGAGFWDSGLGDAGDSLTEAAEVYGSIDPYLGDDGKVYFE